MVAFLVALRLFCFPSVLFSNFEDNLPFLPDLRILHQLNSIKSNLNRLNLAKIFDRYALLFIKFSELMEE